MFSKGSQAALEGLFQNVPKGPWGPWGGAWVAHFPRFFPIPPIFPPFPSFPLLVPIGPSVAELGGAYIVAASHTLVDSHKPHAGCHQQLPRLASLFILLI